MGIKRMGAAAVAFAIALGLGAGLAPGSLVCTAWAEEAVQTNWSGGGGAPGPVEDWGDGFESAAGASWLAVPGQLALAGAPIEDPEETVIDESFDGPVSLFVCDLDGDGDQDVLGAARHTDQIAYWRNEGGDPIQWTFISVDDSFDVALTVFACDLDGDQDLDILAGGYDAAQIAWWRNDGGQPIAWAKQIVDDDFPGAHQVYAEDIDGDGRPDVVCCTQSEDRIGWWRNEGGDPITWTRHLITASFIKASSVFVTDLDGDGHRDVLGAGCYSPGQIAWWRNDGGDPVGWEFQAIDPGCYYAHWVHAGDMDGDGDTDVVGASYGGSRLQWWRNEGGDPIVWTELNIVVGFYHALVSHAADLDGDGDLDVVGTACDAGAVKWWENENGLGTAWVEHRIDATHPGAWPAHVGDLDGDGALDVVAAAETVDRVSWWRVSRFQSEGELVSSVLDTRASSLEEATIDWAAVTPGATSLSLQVRSGSDPSALGPWSEEIIGPGPVSGSLERYLQYRVRIATADSLRSPILQELRFDWTPQGSSVTGERGQGALPLLRLSAPARRDARIEFVLPARCRVGLHLFDSMGRLVRTLAEGVFAEGRHRVDPGRLASGVYLCRLVTPRERAVDRLVVVE